MKVETMNEIDELQAARSRIRELETSLADAHMDYCLEGAFLDIACERRHYVNIHNFRLWQRLYQPGHALDVGGA